MHRIATVLFAGILLSSSALAAQFQIVPRVGVGGRTEVTVYAGVLARFVLDEWGLFAGIGARVFGESCTASVPPRCSVPGGGDATEVSAGLRRVFLDAPWLPAYVSAGVGVLGWEGMDLFIEAEAGMRARISGSVGFEFGVHGLVAPGVERQTPTLIVSRQNIWLLEIIIGIGIGLH